MAEREGEPRVAGSTGVVNATRVKRVPQAAHDSLASSGAVQDGQAVSRDAAARPAGITGIKWGWTR